MSMFDARRENSDEPRSARIESATTEPSTGNAHISIPVFRYAQMMMGPQHYGTIMVRYEVFHKIQNMEDFYAALGNNEDEKSKGFSGEEFVWNRYKRDGSKMSNRCLQVQIQNYLHNNSAKFRELYGHEYNEMIGKCSSTAIDDNDKHCANCPMLPKESGELYSYPSGFVS
jgi:hypothetical protein